MVRQSVAEILAEHVTFELEAIDRMYLNAYVPSLQTGAGFVYFTKTQLKAPVASTVMVAPMSQRFVQALERFAAAEGVDLVTFERGKRKDDVMQRYLAAFHREEGILFIGKAQEKAHVFRTEKRRDARGTYPWIVRSTAMVNHYYVYLVDRDFGPLFIKFCSYFPYPAKLCLNGHEWLKRDRVVRRIQIQPDDTTRAQAGRTQRGGDRGAVDWHLLNDNRHKSTTVLCGRLSDPGQPSSPSTRHQAYRCRGRMCYCRVNRKPVPDERRYVCAVVR